MVDQRGQRHPHLADDLRPRCNVAQVSLQSDNGRGGQDGFMYPLWHVRSVMKRRPRVQKGTASGRHAQGDNDDRRQDRIYLIGENGAASRILVSCLTTGLSPGGGQIPSAVAFLRMATRSSRLL